MPDYDEPCANCGHTYEEHRYDTSSDSGGHECEVEDCGCLCFETE